MGPILTLVHVPAVRRVVLYTGDGRTKKTSGTKSSRRQDGGIDYVVKDQTYPPRLPSQPARSISSIVTKRSSGGQARNVVRPREREREKTMSGVVSVSGHSHSSLGWHARLADHETFMVKAKVETKFYESLYQEQQHPVITSKAQS